MVAMLKGWNNETVLHENRSYFPGERKCIVHALQHGRQWRHMKMLYSYCELLVRFTTKPWPNEIASRRKFWTSSNLRVHRSSCDVTPDTNWVGHVPAGVVAAYSTLMIHSVGLLIYTVISMLSCDIVTFRLWPVHLAQYVGHILSCPHIVGWHLSLRTLAQSV